MCPSFSQNHHLSAPNELKTSIPLIMTTNTTYIHLDMHLEANTIFSDKKYGHNNNNKR